MANFRRSRIARASCSRYLALGVSAFVVVNLFLLLHSPVQHKSNGGGAGEGSHRYRQTEDLDFEERSLAEQGAFDVSNSGGAQEQEQQQVAEAAVAAADRQDSGGSSSEGGGGGSSSDACHAEVDADFGGEDVIEWGDRHRKDSAGDCCAACQSHAPRCNVWVYCARPEGCAEGRQHRECWLKHARQLNPIEPQGRRAPGIGWVSGAVYTQAELGAALKRIADKQTAEQHYLDDLRNNETLPMVFLDVEIKGKPVGRIEMVLFSHISPRAAENFRQLCTGESGTVPNEPGREGAGRARHFKGAYFYRIIDQFIDQTGVETESVFGGQFKDDPGGLKLKHEHKGLLSMANMGHDTNTAHFSIMMGPAHHLDGDYTIFGQVVSGFDVVDAINALSKGKPDNTATAADGAKIVESGQIRKGTIVPDLQLGL